MPHFIPKKPPHPMSSLWETFTFHDLRAIATRLDLSPSATATKAELVVQVHLAHQDPLSLNQLVVYLPVEAKEALWWLCHAACIPAAPFWSEFGTVRRVTGRTRHAPPPWQEPQSAAEALFYSGLLHPWPGETLARSRLLTLAPDVRRHLQPLVAPFAPTLRPAAIPLPSIPLPSIPLALSAAAVATLAQTAVATLCHDVGHYLIYLHQMQIGAGQPLALRYGRWLTPLHLRALAPRLCHQLPAHQLRSHKGSAHLRLLAFLTTVASLQSDGRVTPLGWAWLAQTRTQQMATLWQGWITATQEARRSFGLADGAFAAPWPQLLLTGFVTCPTPFTTDQLAAAILAASGDFAAYWAAHLPLLQVLAIVVADLVDALLVPLGLLVELPTTSESALLWYRSPEKVCPTSPVGPMEDVGQTFSGKLYQWTAHGEALANGALAQPEAVGQTHGTVPNHVAAEEGQVEPPSAQMALTTTLEGTWLVTCSAAASLHSQAVIAGFAEYLTPEHAARQRSTASTPVAFAPIASAAPPRLHHYQIRQATLARAAARGLGLPALQAALQAAGIAVTAAQWQAWSLAHQAGHALHIETVTLLRTQQPSALAALLARPALSAKLTEILAPTVAVVGTAVPDLLAALAASGDYPTLVGTAHDTPPAVAGSSPIAVDRAQAAALWLAGELYTLLNHHLPLPAPPSILPQATLFAALSSPMQATVTAQRQVIADGLATLLDHLPFTPPPTPSEPTEWLPTITRALDQQQRLLMTYFSAGRNLATQRLVEPYWVEEHYSVPYLRAYCHSAGRVLTFRLDRIQALVVVVSESR